MPSDLNESLFLDAGVPQTEAKIKGNVPRAAVKVEPERQAETKKGSEVINETSAGGTAATSHLFPNPTISIQKLFEKVNLHSPH